MSMGGSEIHDTKQIVMTLDHDVQNKSESNLKKCRQIKEFAKKQRVDFYPAGRGIGHQIMVEEGYAWPGTLVVASDSHANMYGGVGCLVRPLSGQTQQAFGRRGGLGGRYHKSPKLRLPEPFPKALLAKMS